MTSLKLFKKENLEMSETATRLDHIENYKFEAQFDTEGLSSLTVDELKPIGQGAGPNPTQLLSAAVGHCLSASLIYCLRKAQVTFRNLATTVKAETARNEEGRLRIKTIEVQIRLGVENEDRARVSRCLEIFENYCTVTESVRKGINVNLEIVQPDGHQSSTG